MEKTTSVVGAGLHFAWDVAETTIMRNIPPELKVTLVTNRPRDVLQIAWGKPRYTILKISVDESGKYVVEKLRKGAEYPVAHR